MKLKELIFSNILYRDKEIMLIDADGNACIFNNSDILCNVVKPEILSGEIEHLQEIERNYILHMSIDFIND